MQGGLTLRIQHLGKPHWFRLFLVNQWQTVDSQTAYLSLLKHNTYLTKTEFAFRHVLSEWLPGA